MYSALKRDGKPLYEYARAGQTLEREARQVTIQRLELLNVVLSDVSVRVTCSKGTYIRTLAEDIGEALGCGAHLGALRRTRVGALTLEHAVTLDALSDAEAIERDRWLQPVDALLSSFTRVSLTTEEVQRFRHGQRLQLASVAELNVQDGDRVCVYDETECLLGAARLSSGVLTPERLVVSGHPK